MADKNSEVKKSISDSIETKLKETPDFVEKLLPYVKYVSYAIIIILIGALLITILVKLYDLFIKDIPGGNFTLIIADLLLTLILIELFTILYSYLHRHYIKVERVVELGMISIVREMLFHVTDFEVARIYAIAALLISFGAIFFIEKHWSSTRNT